MNDITLSPVMLPVEADTIRRHVASSSYYLEYGLGGSTTLALGAGSGTVTSVESDPAWIDKVKADARISPHISSGRLSILAIDIGPVIGWGTPKGDAHAIKWPSYVVAPFSDGHRKPYDVVLVDGRFRVACALVSAICCQPDTVILIHDYAKRPSYHVVENYLQLTKVVGTMAILRKKDDIDVAEAMLTAIRHLRDTF